MPAIPPTFGRYQIVKLLGSGAMGKVYLAQDPTLARKVALKVVALDPAIDGEVRRAYLIRFSAEAKALAGLDHQCIVQIFDTGEERNNPWISFQLVDGESLETVLSRRGRLGIRRALLFALDIASALHHAHGRNIVHRDVKPANILVESKTGLAKLTDFGIAQASWSKPVEDGSMVGSPGYMSPEQIDGKEVDRRSDIFSLGIVLYQMLSGEQPFLRETLLATIDSTCRGDYTPLQRLVPDVPKALDAALCRCLCADPAMRLGSAAELIDILQTLVPKENAAGKRLDMFSSPCPANAETMPVASRTTVLGGIYSFLHTNVVSRIVASFTLPH
jgi:eukaryotic-like serine/threonine-protein kinase